MPAPANERGQLLLAEEYFAAENDLFVATLRTVRQPRALAGLAERWKKDPRPWTRRQILVYLQHPLNAPGHQPIVKRLFKQAEAVRDHELMGAFLVAFDGHVRRQIRTQQRWDSATRSVFEQERLVTPRDVLPAKVERTPRNSQAAERLKLFRYRTRYYLRRRAWRYFRVLGYRDPVAYRAAVVRALAAYQDAQLQNGENILDSWGLMHACFAGHDALEFGTSQIQLKDGRSLGELSPAPRFPEVWKKPDAAPVLLSLVVQAGARLVRVWAMQLFEREHANFAVDLETIVRLLDHEDSEIQQFGAKLLESGAGLGTLPVASWLRLLRTRNEEALQRICDAFAKHVSNDRLDLRQCVELACDQPVPVARLGQRYLRERMIHSSADRDQIAALANAKCPAVAGELTAWALGILGTREHYACDQMIRFFDSTLAETRAAAWTWLLADSAGLGDPMLWSRLAETPHDDLRLRVIDFLQKQTRLPGINLDNLQNVWRSVLLGVHRGGRQKARAVRQIAQAILDDAARADALLPVLAVAVRSVRGPEARAGLAAVVSVVEARPQLAEAVRRHLPEVKFAEAPA